VCDWEEFASVQQDRAEQVGGVLPSQRVDPATPGAPDGISIPSDAPWLPTVSASAPVRPASAPADLPAAAGPAPSSPPAADPAAAAEPAASAPAPGQSAKQRGVDETVVLPAFVTGKREAEAKAAEPTRHQPGDALPPSERGMLIFVAALLGVGTLAVVTILGLGGFSAKPAPAHPKPPPVASVYPTPTPLEAPSTSPAAVPPPSPSASPSTRRTASPRPLGTLTANDPAAYCTYKKSGRAHLREDGTWVCLGAPGHDGFLFSPTDVCKWRYLRNTAFAVVGNPADPTTWKCLA
jgi:hypothetical protein